MEDREAIKNHVVDFFKDLYIDLGISKTLLDGVHRFGLEEGRDCDPLQA